MTNKSNKVFIATSLDGFIADKQGGIEWLDTFPKINTVDTGFKSFVAGIDALLMGRATFEKVSSFDIDWPYEKPVFVLSNSWSKLKGKFKDEAILVNGTIKEALSKVNDKGYHTLYLDGGNLIQGCLKEDLVDEMIITIIPILLGAGIPLFSNLPEPLKFKCISTNVFFDTVVQNHFVREY